MRLNTVQELFSYLSSLERSNVLIMKNNCTIWLPNGVVLNGKSVDKIDYSSKELVDCENSFVYTNDKIVSIESFRMDVLQSTPESFLNFIFYRYPEISPIEHRLSEQLSAFEQALREMITLRIQIGKLKREFDEVQGAMFKLQREQESSASTLIELKEKCHRKSTQLAESWIPFIKSNSIINVIQLRAIHSFVINDVGSSRIFIKTGYQENIVRLTYLITRWGSADLEGIPVGADDAFAFFNQDGQQTAEVPRSSGSSISIEWDELLILLKHFESQV